MSPAAYIVRRVLEVEGRPMTVQEIARITRYSDRRVRQVVGSVARRVDSSARGPRWRVRP